MTAQTIDQSTISAELPAKKEYAVERPRVPLVLKLFLLTALLIAIVVAVAVGITIQRANAIANETVNRSITGAATLFQAFEKQRLDGLAGATQVLGSDVNFYAYIQQAISGGDVPAESASAESTAATAAASPQPTPTAAPAEPQIDYPSINDQLLQQRDRLATDVMLLLDEQGILLARTDKPMVAGGSKEDFYERTPLVRQLVDSGEAKPTIGVLRLDGKLFHAAVAPVEAGARSVRIGYLINAYAIDEKFANRIAESTNAGVVFTTKDNATTVRSTNAPSVMPKDLGSQKTITVDQSRYILTSKPLASGAGTAVFLRSLDRELAPFREIERTMIIAGGVALLLAFLFSWLIAKRVTRPIERLASIAQAVTAGDYSVDPNVDRNDEVGILGRSFGKMINSLRDKAELEELYEQMAEKAEQAEQAPAARPSQPARLDEGTVLVTDLRGLPPTVGEGDAATVIGAVERAMRLQEREVARQDGEVREIAGHRLVCVFRGERGIIHAIRAARAINEELALHGGTMSVGVGIASGEFVTGSVSLDVESGPAILGNAPLLALLFAWHAPNGFAYVSYETAQAAGAEVFNAATREEVKLKWLPNALPVAALPLVNVTTGMMKAVGGTMSSEATMRMGATAAGVTAPASPYADLVPGHTFANRYRIESILGRGGMGVVYKATDTQLDETVAIKTLPGDVMTRSPEDLERFKREIRLARKITHRNVLRTFDYGEAEGVYFISMEFVRGYALSELMDEAPARRMPARAAVGIARQICRGLHAAHEQGIIHRDIKPQNVLIDAKGEVKLMDFGIARMTETTESAQMTQAGLIVGTPHYMSPEQVQGKALDPRTDVYAMGVLLYELLVGKRPFEATSLTAILTAHIMEKAVPVMEQRPDVGRAVNGIVMRCLEKDPAVRYADAGALLTDLDRVQMPAAAAA